MTQHEPYLSRVVRALVVAGITVRSWSADQEPGEPLTASIALPVDGRLIWLGWDEQSSLTATRAAPAPPTGRPVTPRPSSPTSCGASPPGVGDERR